MSFNQHRKTCSCTHHNGSTGTYCFHGTGFSLSPGVLEQRLSARVENGPTKLRLSRRARVVRPVSECDWLSPINRQCYIDVAKDSSYRQSQDSNCTDCIVRSYVQGFSEDTKMESWAVRGSSECLPGQTQHLLPRNVHNKISLSVTPRQPLIRLVSFDPCSVKEISPVHQFWAKLLWSCRQIWKTINK